MVPFEGVCVFVCVVRIIPKLSPHGDSPVRTCVCVYVFISRENHFAKAASVIPVQDTVDLLRALSVRVYLNIFLHFPAAQKGRAPGRHRPGDAEPRVE